MPTASSIMTRERIPAGAIDDLPAGGPEVREDEGEVFLERLLRAEGPAVKAVLMQKFSGTLSGADIDDVLAVALNRVWLNRDRFDAGRGSLRTWFFRIAHNSAIDVLKHGWHRARELEIPGGGDFLTEIAGELAESNPDRAQAESHRVVREIIAALPEAQRRIVWADAQHRHGPTPSKDLARELEIPVGTVRVYRKRALDRIRRELEDRQLDPESISQRKKRP